jgi:hypothetical protein
MIALGLAAGGNMVANANDLYNADLDILGAAGANGQLNPGPLGWVITAVKTISGPFTDGADSETFCNVQQPGGYGLFFKPFQGSTNANPSLDDLLSVYFYQDNPSSPGTECTLSGYASCEANFCGLLPAPPGQSVPQTLFVVEFLDGGGTVLASNTFDLIANGMHTDGAGDMGLLTTPQYTAPAGTVTVRAGASLIGAYSTTGAQSFFVDAFDLESVAPPGSPVITNQPSATTVQPGATATLTVGISNAVGATFQWQMEGVALTDGAGISGSSSQTLTITGASTNNVGHYRVRVSNGVGSVLSTTVPLALVGVNFYPIVVINGNIGDVYRVDYATALDPTTWIPLATNTLTMSPQLVVDGTTPISRTRFYRAVFLH